MSSPPERTTAMNADKETTTFDPPLPPSAPDEEALPNAVAASSGAATATGTATATATGTAATAATTTTSSLLVHRRPVPHELCQTLERNLHNLGKSLSCSICHSTPSLGNAVLLSECVHLFCSTCLQMAFRNQQQQQGSKKDRNNKSGLNCPVCRQVVTRRSAIDAPDNYQQAIWAYKRMLQAFGMAPMLYSPHLCMTQVPTIATNTAITMSPSCAKANYQMSVLLAEHYASRRRSQQQPPLASSAKAAPSSALEREQNEIVKINRRYYQKLAAKKDARGRRRAMRGHHGDDNPSDDEDGDNGEEEEDLVGDSFEAGADGDAAAAPTDKLAGLVGLTTTTTTTASNAAAATARMLRLPPHNNNNNNANVAATQDSWIDKARDQSAADAAWEEQCRIDEGELEEDDEVIARSPRDKEVLESNSGPAEEEEEEEAQKMVEKKQEIEEDPSSAAAAAPPVLVDGGVARNFPATATEAEVTAPQPRRRASEVDPVPPRPLRRAEVDERIRRGEEEDDHDSVISRLLDEAHDTPHFFLHEFLYPDDTDLLELSPASVAPGSGNAAHTECGLGRQPPMMPPPQQQQQHHNLLNSDAVGNDDHDGDTATVRTEERSDTPSPPQPKDDSGCSSIDKGFVGEETVAPGGKDLSDVKGEGTNGMAIRGNAKEGTTEAVSGGPRPDQILVPMIDDALHPADDSDDEEFDFLSIRSPFARTLPPPPAGNPADINRGGQQVPHEQQHGDSKVSTVATSEVRDTPFPPQPKADGRGRAIDNGVVGAKDDVAPGGKGRSDIKGEVTKKILLSNGNKGPTVLPTQSGDAPNHGIWLNLEDSGPVSTNGALPVGTVVNVAPRTWPGMNKLGGVGRVTKVHHLPEPGQGVAYSVQYVLGGTESRVDAVFVTRYSDDGMGTTTKRSACGEESGADDLAISVTPSARRHRKSNRLEQHNTAGWSPSLIEKLASEGFDVTAVGPTGKAVVHNQRKRPGTETGADNRRAKKLRRIGSSIAEFVRRRLPRGGGQHADSEKVAARSPNQKENPPDNKTAPTPPNTPPSPAMFSIAECCRRADALYNERVQQAQSKGCIYVATSSLTDEDNAALDRLCKDTKSSKVQVKRMDRIDAKKTTFCLIRTNEVQRSDAEPDLTANKRTIKAMQATLAGVPLLCCSWLRLCQNDKEVCPPTPNMWVRSLPCPSKNTAFGVARLAAHLYDDGCYRPLAGIAVHFCGTIPRQKAADMSFLLRDAGAMLIPNSAAFISHLTKSSAQASTSVLVCGSGVKLGRALEAKLRLTMPGAVRVVHPGWVFDCVSWGQVLGASEYEPTESGTQARDLWKLTSPKGET